MPISTLERYRDLIDDWPGFLAAVAAPLPVCLRANTLRLGAEPLGEILATEGLAPRALPWHDAAWRLPADTPVGNRWWYAAGFAHAQEAVSLLPVLLLEAQPGERVLDLCAAPGGKTAALAAAMGNRGTLVANDVTPARMRPLVANLERLGVCNATVTCHDGAAYPGPAGAYDRVLVDAPCSCEGTVRRQPAFRMPAPEMRERHQRRQRALLARALDLCRPGGRVVYATCTFAPEENEQVVARALDDADGAVRLLPAAVAGFTAAPGVTHWDGRALDPALAGCLRVWPHHNDTGGFFVAVLEKEGAPGARRAWPAGADAASARDTVAAVAARYGVAADALRRWRVAGSSSRGLYLAAADHQPPPAATPVTTGLLAVRTTARPAKLATAGAALLAPHATRNRLELDAAQARAYCARESVPLSASQGASLSAGPVIVTHAGAALGVAALARDGRALHSLFPKRRATPAPSPTRSNVTKT